MLKYWPLRSGIDIWPSCPILPFINKIKIVCDIGWSPAISAWDCHLIHDNDIGLLLTAAMKCLHWSLFCQINLSEYFRMNFPSTFCKRTSFQSAFFTQDQFSLGPAFIEPSFLPIVPWESDVAQGEIGRIFRPQKVIPPYSHFLHLTTPYSYNLCYNKRSDMTEGVSCSVQTIIFCRIGSICIRLWRCGWGKGRQRK